MRNGDHDGAVSLFRGLMDIPTREEKVYPSPLVRAVPAHGSLTGSAVVALPLKSWHNFHASKMPPLTGNPAQAYLEIQILPTLGDPERNWARSRSATARSPSIPIFDFSPNRGRSSVQTRSPSPS